MIKPEEIPEFTGDLEQLEKDYGFLKKDAGQVRSTGADVHTQFQGLSAYYKAPEADQLFASTKPVSDRADAFGTDLETVSSALSGYAAEIRPLVTKLKQLKHDAQTFVDSVEGDDDWQYDEDKVKKNNQLRDDVTATVAAFWAAERTCHNKITALWHGTQMIAGDGTDKKNMYGYSASDLKGAKGLPWGDPVEQKHHWYDVGHWVKSFVWDGIVVDGIWGTVKGLGTLVGVDGWDAMKTAWKGLAQLATGLAFMSNPVLAVAFWATPDKYMPSWLRESRNTMKQTGKALLAWDEWGKNPARAAGGVTFNVLTAVFTDGAGAAAEGAGKAGAVAKAISFAGKAGRVIDPMTYVMKGAGAGLSKIGDISKALKGAGKIDIPELPDNAITLPEGTVHLPDGTVHLPEGAAIPKGAVELPDGSVRLPNDAPLHPAGTEPLHTPEGEPPLFADEHGNIVDHKGDVLMHHDGGPPDITNRPPTGSDVPHTPSPAKQPALVGAGAHGADQAGEHIHLGSGLDDTGRVGENVPTSPGVHAGGDIPTIHAGGDHIPGNGLGDHLPGGTADHLPGGRADAHMPTNSVDTRGPAGTTDHAGVPAAVGDHVPSGHGGDIHTPGRDLPVQGGALHLPGHGAVPPIVGSGLDDLGRAGDDAGAGGHAGSDAGTSPHDTESGRPSFMHDGDNPYGPEGSLTDKQIHDIQVYRANHEPGYFEDFYKSNGNRKSLAFSDESGRTPPQLTRESPQHPWGSVKDAPEPLRPNYLGDAIKGGRDTATPEALKTLDDAAAHRHHAVAYDTAAGKHKAEAVDVHKHAPTPETELHQLERTYEYKSAHRDMRDHAEAYGEAIAEQHVIPEHYPNATREPLDGPLNGNDQFDQVWRREDGGYVVVEAKSNVTTELGARNLPSGKRVSQGTREYFLDIIREMKKRGETNPAERKLARQLEDALDDHKLDYIVVKGEKNAGQYAGYSMRQFDIADRSTL
ncbi:hypothetical protein [Streptomyces murinus]|uniref:hypothetical protein n=1 Tax=Streptomyces murinus TaxID=33900 RepID=UPI002E1301DF|nr:hypothetical protein OG516_13535 [Streptomyces murinus]